MTQQVKTTITYTPSSLVGIFVNSLTNETTRKVFSIKGVYCKGRGTSYSGYYYDILKDENSDGYITLFVPARLRAGLVENKTIECIGYLEKRADVIGAKVKLQVNVTDILSQEESRYTDEQLKGFELLQRKTEIGHKDVDSIIRAKIANREPISVTILIGKNSIIETDIKHQLKEAVHYYKIFFLKINLSSEREIIEHLIHYSRKCDLLAIARGGGDGLEVFNKPEIAETALGLETPFITAIGHEQDVTLLQKVADKAFITPTSLGEYLRSTYNSTVEQLQSSKAKLIEDISRQFKANYEKQIEALNEQIESLKDLNRQAVDSTMQVSQKEITLLNTQISALTKQHQLRLSEVQELQKKVGSSTSLIMTIIFIVVAVIIGIVIGKVL